MCQHKVLYFGTPEAVDHAMAAVVGTQTASSYQKDWKVHDKVPAEEPLELVS